MSVRYFSSRCLTFLVLLAVTVVADLPSFSRSTHIVEDRQRRVTKGKRPAARIAPFYTNFLSKFLEHLRLPVEGSIHEVRNHPVRRLCHPPVVESWPSPILIPSDGLPPRPPLRPAGAKRLEHFA